MNYKELINYYKSTLAFWIIAVVSFSARSQNIIKPVNPTDLVKADICYDANPGTSANVDFRFYSAGCTANENRCYIMVSQPVDLVFSFHDYYYHGMYGDNPSGVARLSILLEQKSSYDNEKIIDYQFRTAVNRVTNELSYDTDTVLYLLPGSYLLTFTGVAKSLIYDLKTKSTLLTQPSLSSINSNLYTASNQGDIRVNSSMIVGPYHSISVSISASAIKLEKSDGDLPGIPTPDKMWAPTVEGSEDKNCVYSFISSSGDKTAGVASIVYYDGFGREEEFVDIAASPDKKDLVRYKEYDGYGREGRMWLSSKSQSGVGEYMSLNQCKNASVNTNNDNEPFSYLVYENTPMNRVLDQYGVGELWHKKHKCVHTEYYFNGTGELACRLYKIDSGMTISSSGNYPDGMLQVIKVQDEDGRTILEFKDKQDRTVLVRKVLMGKTYADTYYLYDGLGRICAILPPELSLRFVSGTCSQDLIDNYAYLYKYDKRDHVVEKKLPGVDWCRFTYDDRDRLVFSADGEQQSRCEQTFYLYDDLNRECVRGTSNALFVGDINSITCKYTGEKGSWMGYSVTGVNLTNVCITNVNYYDTYDFLSDTKLPNKAPLYGVVAPHTRGLLTGTATIRYGKTTATNNRSSEYDYTLLRYDERNRVIHTESTNHLGGYDIENIKINHIGSPLERRVDHSSSSISSISEWYKYTYDHMSRLLKIVHKLNNGKEVVLVDNHYDNLGRLQSDSRNGAISTKYSYNVRGSVTDINSGSVFREELFYENVSNGAEPCYSGKIASIKIKSPNYGDSQYNYTYDGLSRLTKAVYNDLSGDKGRNYSTSYSYDLMGNITSLQRYGLQDDNSYDLVDCLDYDYNGNQIKTINDDILGPTYEGAFHFRDGADDSKEYAYDRNGNMTKDLNKNILSIQYNVLSLPSQIKYANGLGVEYVYNDLGKKLRVTYRGANSVIMKMTDYCSNKIYEDKKLSQIMVDNGFITFKGSMPEYHFYQKDHLGNVCAVTDEFGKIEQENLYYPYGGLHGDNSSNGDFQRFKYNGKELDRVNGIDWYDYGARHYDLSTARFTTMDPLAEKDPSVSPYAYCAGDPVNCVDPTGEAWISATYGNQTFYCWDENIKCQEDIAKRYYYGDTKNAHSIQFIGETASVDYRGQTISLGEGGEYQIGDGAKQTSETDKDGLHIGSAPKGYQMGDNYYGVYLGPYNPETKIGASSYCVPPIDGTDYAAFCHDKAYDKAGAAGVKGALFNTDVCKADMQLSVDCKLNEKEIRKMSFFSEYRVKRARWNAGAKTLFVQNAMNKLGIKMVNASSQNPLKY